ncbi:hypothetical protein CA983_44370 [Streptomyces swartbergensis]|uniref:Uncharacterized protein n=1 Tax=Streptomyces swartbergensis TaxID=487165 RepID=A0A243Q368_9ACTN|nr:hypothetical protein CA983_44370 [Streptomyces swartbergensis]
MHAAVLERVVRARTPRTPAGTEANGTHVGRHGAGLVVAQPGRLLVAQPRRLAAGSWAGQAPGRYRPPNGTVRRRHPSAWWCRPAGPGVAWRGWPGVLVEGMAYGWAAPTPRTAPVGLTAPPARP